MLPESNPQLERVRFELRATGVKEEQANRLRSGIHTRGYLPHVKREYATYFVTFRLADSLPKEVLFKLLQERAQQLAHLHAGPASHETKGVHRSKSDALRNIERDYFRKMEAYLDKGSWSCWLNRPEIADEASRAIRSFDKVQYQLKAWVVMPNHVHVVIWPMPNYTLSAILKGWKGSSAREANRLLGRIGHSFWQTESYDHWIRDDLERDRCCRYVINNPVKARLCRSPEDWRWSSAGRGEQA